MAYTAKLLIRDVICVPSDRSVEEAARVMLKADIGSVIVGTLAKPEGILTERDITRRVVAAGLEAARTPIRSVMTAKITSVEASEPLDHVFKILSEAKFRHLPITEGGKVVGIVSLTDLAKVLQEVYRDDKYLQYFADVVASR